MDKQLKIGLPGKPDYDTREPIFYAKLAEAFGNNPEEQRIFAIEYSRREFKTESQLIDKAFGA